MPAARSSKVERHRCPTARCRSGCRRWRRGLTFPLYLTAPPGDPRLFVVEKGGAIRIIKDGSLLPTPFLDLARPGVHRRRAGAPRPRVRSGLCDRPAASSCTTPTWRATPGSRPSTCPPIPTVADPASEPVILTADQPFANHNGGPDPVRTRWLALPRPGRRRLRRRSRAAGASRWPTCSGPFCRVDVSSGTAATQSRPTTPSWGMPAHGPRSGATGFGIPGASASIRAHRRPLHRGRRPETRWEEVDVAPAADGAGRGVNYRLERHGGTPLLRRVGLRSRPASTLPVVEYDHGQGCSITGGYVYRGAAIPALQGHYFYADYCPGWVRSFRYRTARRVDRPADGPPSRPAARCRASGRTPPGELYVLSAGGPGIPDRARMTPEELRGAWPSAHSGDWSASGPRPGTTRAGAAWSTTGTTRARARRPGCWRSTRAFPSSAPSASTPASTRRPPRRCCGATRSTCRPGFPA